MNKDALDYLFATGLVRSFRMSNDPDIDDDEIIRLQPKYMLQSARELADGDLELLRKSHKDIINDYIMFVDSLDLKEEFIIKIEKGFDVPLKSLKVLNDLGSTNRELIPLLNLILYYTIKDTPGSLDAINEDFDGLLKNTAYKVELYRPERYVGDIQMLRDYLPFKISFDSELIKDRYDDKLLNSEVIYSTFRRNLYRECRYITLGFVSMYLQHISILIEEPLI